MDNSTLFSYVPHIGAQNIVPVLDVDTGLTQPFLLSVGLAAGAWVPKNAAGDFGNNPAPGTEASFTSTDPEGRAGKMITHLEVIGEGVSAISEAGFMLALVAIPPGETNQLPMGSTPNAPYTLINQPPVDSFDMSSFLPRTAALGKPSLYGTADSYAFLPGTPTGRFPSGPRTRGFNVADAYVVSYIPASFYPDLSTILNDLLTETYFNVTVPPKTALYGSMLIAVHFSYTLDEDYPTLGAGVVTVDFSHSGTN